MSKIDQAATPAATPPGDDLPELHLGGQIFKCRPSLPRYPLLRVAIAEKLGDEMKLVSATVDFLLAVVQPTSRDRLDQLLMEHDEVFDEIEGALDHLMGQYSGNDGGGSASSPPSSTETNQTSRVVSFSQGTVTERPATETNS